MRARLPLALLLFATATSTAWAAPPSFDCGKAQSADEIAICADPDLSHLDRLAALAFDQARRVSGRAAARDTARAGISARGECGSDKPCILAAQVELIRRLQGLGASVSLPDWAVAAADAAGGSSAAGASDGLPIEVGQCVNTRIAEITSRFQADINAATDDGSAVNFENGGHQVSYDKEPGLLHAQVGDPVLMCLVELPQDCPPGDDRGKIYTTTNLRTQESWTLPELAALLRRGIAAAPRRPRLSGRARLPAMRRSTTDAAPRPLRRPRLLPLLIKWLIFSRHAVVNLLSDPPEDQRLDDASHGQSLSYDV